MDQHLAGAIREIKDCLQGVFVNGEVIVQPHSYKGINLKIVSSSFSPSYGEREKVVNQALESIDLDLEDSLFQFVELLTPEENELYGTDLADLTPDHLPFWANALLQDQPKKALKFRDVDVEKEYSSPNIVTYYSFKGGVGRSTALVSTALELAEKGVRAIVVDMDLEAPGLPELLRVELKTEAQKGGVVNLMNRLELEEEIDIDIRDYLVPVTDFLYLMPAGKINPAYIQQLSLIDPRRFYRLENNPVKKMFRMLESLQPKPDVILVDARTGLADISAPLLLEISDLSIIVFYPHPQVKAGLDLLVNGILSRRNRRDLTSELRFVLSPIPESDREQLRIQRQGIEWVQDYLERIRDIRESYNQDPLDTLTEEIVHTIYYNDRMANNSHIVWDEKLLHPYARVTEWVDALLENPEEERRQATETELPAKDEILANMHIETGIAERQDDLSRTYVKTSDYRYAIKTEVVLIVGRKGTGKTALFRMLRQRFGDSSVVVRNSVPGKESIDLVDEEFKEVERRLPEQNWRLYWGACALFHLYRDARYKKLVSEAVNEEILREFKEADSNQNLKRGWLSALTKILDISFLGSELEGSFQKLNDSLDYPVVLLWDGLDRGFGYTDDAKKRQNRIIIGVLDFWNSIDKLDKFQFKVFLRKDLWDRLSFQNKSHLYGRRLDLKWDDKLEYYKTLLKQIYRGVVKNYFDLKYQAQTEGKQLPPQVEDWTEEQVVFVFNLLAGERMRGGKSAYTRNWVWSRLADGNDDHSPRYLFQLFHNALELEKQELIPYEKSLIRPKHLVKSLEAVSEEAVNALILEEYEELKKYKGQLKKKTVPFSTKEVDHWEEDLINLAYDVGLFKVYEEDRDGETLRLTVPDLYLKGLGMFRRGQA